MSSELIDAMPNPPTEGWTYKKLIECTSDGNLSYGIVQPGTHDEKGVPIIRVNNVNNGQLRLNDVLHVSAEIESKYKRTRLEGGEVLLTLVGSTGQSVVAPKELAGWNIARAIAVIRPKPEIGANWINICLQTREVQQFLNERANTTVQKTLNLGDVRELPIPIPPDDVKKRIEDIAMSLADKIELNRQINQTLEQIAQTIFKSWFVDFEPVKAKIEAKTAGRDPERAAMCAISGKLEPEIDQLPPEHYQQLAATAALFPDGLVESELGLIPVGWKVKPLDQIADYLNGLALQKFPPESETDYLPVIKIAQLKKGDTEGTDRASSKLKPEYIVNDGDVLFSWSGSLTVDVWSGGPGALNQHLFKVTSANYPKWFYLYWTKFHLLRFQGIAADKAVTMGHIQRKHLTEALCVAPPAPQMKQFCTLMAPLLDQQIEYRLQSRNITTLRDTLLPKLLSGEIQITDAENQLAEVM